MHSLWLGLLFLHRLGVMNLMMHVALDEHEPLKVRISQGGSLGHPETQGVNSSWVYTLSLHALSQQRARVSRRKKC